MPIRTLTDVGTDQTFVCGQVVSEVNMNNLNDAAQAARYRGETVVNQTGDRRENENFPVLLGEHDSTDKTLFVSLGKTWEFENAGYEKWVMRIRFKLSSTNYEPLLNTGSGYTRLEVKHTDKNGAVTTIWDSEVASPTRGTEIALTVQGIFSNPPTGASTELEAIQLVVTSNRSSDLSGLSSQNWTGFKSFMFKLHD